MTPPAHSDELAILLPRAEHVVVAGRRAPGDARAPRGRRPRAVRPHRARDRAPGRAATRVRAAARTVVGLGRPRGADAGGRRRVSAGRADRPPCARASCACPTAEAMTELGRALPAACGPATCVVLSGDLGAGKTTLTRGIGAGPRRPRRRHLADLRHRPGPPRARRPAAAGPRRRLPAGFAGRARRPGSRCRPSGFGHGRRVGPRAGRGARRGPARADHHPAARPLDSDDESRRSTWRAFAGGRWADASPAGAADRAARVAFHPCCCSPSTPRRPRSPWRCTTGDRPGRAHDGRRPPAGRAAGSAHRAGPRRGGCHAGRPHHGRGGRRAGAVHRAAGRRRHRPGDRGHPGHPGGRGVHAGRPGRGGRRSGAVPTVSWWQLMPAGARCTGRRTIVGGDGRRCATAGPAVSAPGDVPVDGRPVVGRGADLYAGRARPARRAARPVGGRARRRRRRSSWPPGGRCSTPTPLYLRRPDAVVPGPPKPWVVRLRPMRWWDIAPSMELERGCSRTSPGPPRRSGPSWPWAGPALPRRRARRRRAARCRYCDTDKLAPSHLPARICGAQLAMTSSELSVDGPFTTTTSNCPGYFSQRKLSRVFCSTGPRFSVLMTMEIAGYTSTCPSLGSDRYGLTAEISNS